MIITDETKFITIGSRSIQKSKVQILNYDSSSVYLYVSGRDSGHSSGSNVITIDYTSVTSPQVFGSAVELRDWLKGVIGVTAATNQPPVIANQSFSVAELSSNGTALGHVVASDPDGNSITYSIVGGNSAGKFTINSSTGVISVTGLIDYNTTPSFELVIRVTDNGTPSLYTDATAAITVISSPTYVSSEIKASGTLVEVLFDKDIDSDSLLNQESSFAVKEYDSYDNLVSIYTISSIARKTGNNRIVQLTLSTAIEFGEIDKVSYTKGNVASTDTGILQDLSGTVLANNSTIMPANSDFYARYNTAAQEIGNVYYLPDYFGAHNAQLVQSNSNKFKIVNQNGGDSYLQLAAAESAITPANTGYFLYEFWAKMNSTTLTSADADIGKNKILGNGGNTTYPGWGGIYIGCSLDKFRVVICDGAHAASKETVTPFDLNWHKYGFKYVISTKTLHYFVDGVDVDQISCPTLTGSGFATNSKGCIIAGNYGSAEFTLARFRVTRNDVVSFDMPFQHGSTGAKSYDVIGGGSYDIRVTDLVLQDIFPGNSVFGYDLWEKSGQPSVKVPYLADGVTPITPVGLASGYAKTKSYLKGIGLNFAETLFRINGTDYSCAQLATYPYKRNFSKFTDTGISDIICYTADQPFNVKEQIFKLLGFTMFDMSGFIGDSIMHGIAANYNELDASYGQALNEKIWDIGNQQWQDFKKDNCQQPLYGNEKTGTITVSSSSDQVAGVGTLFTSQLAVGNYLTTSDQVNGGGIKIGVVKSIESNTSLTLVANSLITKSATYYKITVYPLAFCCDLGMAKSRNNGRNAEYALGGAVLRGMWLDTTGNDVYYKVWKSNIIAAIRACMIENHYPHWTGMYIALCTNDFNQTIMGGSSPAWPDSRDNVEVYATALIQNLRSLYDEQVPIHWLLPRRADTNRQLGVIELKKVAEPDVFWYPSEDLSYSSGDGVHPNTAGTIQMGEMFYLQLWEDAT